METASSFGLPVTWVTETVLETLGKPSMPASAVAVVTAFGDVLSKLPGM